MNPALLKLIESLLVYALQYGPQLASQVQTAIALLQQQGPLSDDQMAQANAAFDSAHSALMSAIIARANQISTAMQGPSSISVTVQGNRP